MTLLRRIFNIILWCGKAPEYLLESLTTLIPKKSQANAPSDFRPITVSPVLIRALHRVLASRMTTMIRLDQRQRAFRPTDGCSDNVFLLDMVLRHHRKRCKPLFLASLDIAKAFDSVAHATIRETLEVMGLPTPMVRYITDTYKRSTTRLYCNDWSSDKFAPTCGVKQGDPMSPVIFNMIIDRLLEGLPDDVGAKIGELKINAAAFADDMLLFASTPMGLQRLIDQATNFLAKCGLKVNAAKCLTVALKNVPHEKKVVVDRETIFLCQGRQLPALRRSDEWKYLGVPFTPEGRMTVRVTDGLRVAVDKLTRAPLKPQQRLFALRTMVIPGLFHQLELGSTHISLFRKCDKILRHAVRGWLNLPSDTPNAYIHANTVDGGLGIQSTRWLAPLRRLNRLLKLPVAQQNMAGPVGGFLTNEIAQCRTRLGEGGELLLKPSDIRRKWARQLYERVDGVGLRESARVPQQHAWVHEGTRLLSGRDFLQSCKLRINALPTKSRTTRGRPHERLCRAGCRGPETLNHVLQQCHRTHHTRIKRHNAVASYVARGLRRQEYEVEEEPRIQTDQGLRKPDIAAKQGRTLLLIDAQVVNDQIDLDTAHRNKVSYYSPMEELLKEKYQVADVRFTSITVSWRGVWSGRSAEELIDLGILRKKELKIISSRAIIGGLASFHVFNKSTTTSTRMRRRDRGKRGPRRRTLQ